MFQLATMMRLSATRGNAFLEYFVLGMLFILGTIWLYDGGEFHGFRKKLGGAAENVIGQIAR